MPWRNRFIAPRRHPLALACYTMCALLGLFFLLGLFDSQATAQATSAGWQIAWEWELLVGGTVGLASALWPAVQRLDDALTGESLGAVLAGFGFLSWAVSSAVASGWASPGYVVFAVIAVGFGARSWQALLDRRMWLALAGQITDEATR
jgi:hypothetical protein